MPLLLAYSLASWFLDGDESSESQKDGTPATTTTTLSPAEEFVEVLEDSAVIVNFELPDGTKVECLISDENERKDVYQYHTEDILGCNWDKVEK